MGAADREGGGFRGAGASAAAPALVGGAGDHSDDVGVGESLRTVTLRLVMM